jgi:2-polyprenyl-6-methoxyphenol hydroxylase-like FAD-dependent oxidoreductase
VRILIVGAGMAGLTLAPLLRRQGVTPVVVEKRAALERSGYVLGIWPLGGRILQALGLYERFTRESVALGRYSLADGRGAVLQTYPVEFVARTYGPIRMIQRGALVELLSSASGDLVRTGVWCERIEEHDTGVDVTFSDGSSETFDAVIGCDGVHSRVRSLVSGTAVPEPVGWHGWAWWVNPNLARRDTMTEYWDTGRWFCAVYPGSGVLCAFAGLPKAPAAETDVEQVRSRLAAMDAIVPGILDYLGATEHVFHDDFTSLRMTEWRKGRIALAGDACSVVFPFGGLGIGASMAMESAAVLAAELTRADERSVTAALDRYERRRKPRVAVVEEASRAVVRRMLHVAPGTSPPRRTIQEQREMFDSFKRLLDQPP